MHPAHPLHGHRRILKLFQESRHRIPEPTLRDEDDNGTWPTAMATVLSCTYNIGAGRTMAFGLPTSKHFLITYNYEADGTFHIGEFRSSIAMPQGTLFPITYNPEAAHEHNHTQAAPPTRAPLLAIGFAGTVILSLLWFAGLHGCRPN